MLELPHTVVGAVIAAKVGNPALGLPLALASHFILDLAPHWNPHLNTEIKQNGRLSPKTQFIICADVLLSVGAGVFIASQALPDRNAFAYIILGGLMGILPDAIEAPYFLLRWNYPFVQDLIKFQKKIQNDAPIFWGLATQVIVLAVAFWWLYN